MKLELTCTSCQTVLRVDAQHAGKQLRCPTCQGLTQIPYTSASIQPIEPEPSKYRSPMQDWEPSSNPASPASVPHRIPASQSSDEVISLVFGIMGILLNFGCGCLFPIWLILNLYGLYIGYRSRGNLRKAALILNAISIGVGVLMAGWFVLSLAFSR